MRTERPVESAPFAEGVHPVNVLPVKVPPDPTQDEEVEDLVKGLDLFAEHNDGLDFFRDGNVPYLIIFIN